MAVYKLEITVSDEQHAAFMARFMDTSRAVDADEDEGTPGDPNGDKRDKFGVIWDARFHGANMAKNQDGSWRRRKGLSDQEKTDADAYEAGCKSSAAPAAVVAAGVAPAPAPVADVPAFLQTGVMAAPAPVAMPMPGLPLPVAPVAPPAPAPVSYQDLVAAFAETINRVGQPTVDANLARIYGEAGLNHENVGLLETSEDVRRAVKTALERLM